jgi:hypothetical protein
MPLLAYTLTDMSSFWVTQNSQSVRSKKLANHIGAIQLFIGHVNLTRAAA